jgi:hypothetical protein
MSNPSKWNHGNDNTGRFRGGKTVHERKSGAHAARLANRQKPIRCTSSHKLGSQDNRGVEFWGG